MLNPFDAAYHDLCEDILAIGKNKDDRTQTGTVSKFGHQLRFDLTKGFPLLTTKKCLLNWWLQSYCGLLKVIRILDIYYNTIIISGMNGLLKNILNPLIIMGQI